MSPLSPLPAHLRVVVTTLACASVLGTSSLRADEGRFQDFAVGARAASLGGAFGALADDATGAFYNPAGIVDVRTAKVNVSTSLYGLEIIGANPIQSDLLRRAVTPSDLIFVPSSTGYVQGVGDTLPSGAYKDAFALATLVPEYTSRFTEENPPDKNGTRYRSDLDDRRLLAGAAWAHRFGPWLRAGLSLQYELHQIDDEESLVSGDVHTTDASGAPSTTFIDASSRLRAYNHALRAVGGVKLWLGPRATLGLTLTSPAASIYRDASFERVTTSAAGYSADRVNTAGFEFQSDEPGSARLGFAFSEPASYTVAVDVTGYLPTSYDMFPQNLVAHVATVPIPLRVERGAVGNVSAGVEALVTDDFSLAAGVFTNFTGAPALTLDKNGALTADSSRLSTVNMLGGSLSVGFHGEWSVTRIGFTGSSGAGDVVEPSSPSARLVDGGPPLQAVHTQQTLLYLFIATTVRFGDNSSARDDTL